MPLSELASALRVSSRNRRLQAEGDRMNLYREVAPKYNVQRLTPNVVERFELAQRIAFDESEHAAARS